MMSYHLMGIPIPGKIAPGCPATGKRNCRTACPTILYADNLASWSLEERSWVRRGPGWSAVAIRSLCWPSWGPWWPVGTQACRNNRVGHRLLYSPGLLAVDLLIVLLGVCDRAFSWLSSQFCDWFNWNIDWGASCRDALWARVTGGNFHRF